MFDNQKITMINFNRPLRARKDARKHVGPYTWTVPPLGQRGDGRGFYFDKRGSMGDSTFSLRLVPADEYWPDYRRSRGTTGYSADEYGDCAIQPYVAVLPRGRGFLAAYGEGPGMWGAVDYGIHATAEEAARAAHDAAERCADREREYRASEDAEEDAAD